MFILKSKHVSSNLTDEDTLHEYGTLAIYYLHRMN